MEYREATEVRWQSAIAEPAPNSGCGGEQEHQAAEGLALLSPRRNNVLFSEHTAQGASGYLGMPGNAFLGMCPVYLS